MAVFKRGAGLIGCANADDIELAAQFFKQVEPGVQQRPANHRDQRLPWFGLVAGHFSIGHGLGAPFSFVRRRRVFTRVIAHDTAGPKAGSGKTIRRPILSPPPTVPDTTRTARSAN